MEQVRLISTDGECEITINKNYLQQGRPGFTVSFADENGLAVRKEFPLEPKALIDILTLMSEAEHHMLEFLAKHLYSITPAEDLIVKAADNADSNIYSFKRKD